MRRHPWRLATLVGHLLADICYPGTYREDDPLDAAADRKITTGRTPRGRARQCRQGDTGTAGDQGIDIGPPNQFAASPRSMRD